MALDKTEEGVGGIWGKEKPVFHRHCNDQEGGI